MQKLIVGNWKLYVSSPKEGKALLASIKRSLPKTSKTVIVICPPVTLAVYLRDSYSGKRIAFGTQDVSTEVDGSHTGEVSARSLKESGIEYVMVGHAERRGKGDTDEVVSKKAAVALAEGLQVIMCVGEKERDQDGAHFAELKKNVLHSLERVEPEDAKRITIAYDPLWAIGNAEAPTPRIIKESIIFIRKTLVEMWGRERGLKVRIIYGGSAMSESAKSIRDEGGVDGLLLGRASVDPQEFSEIIKSFS